MMRSLTPLKPALVLYRGARSVASVVALTTLASIASVASFAAPALADVRREGEWPAATSEKKVTLNFEKTARRLAVKKLADAAGWSIVVPSDLEDPVDVAVKDQPAGKVLDLLLEGGNFVAKRDGTMVFVARASGASGTIATKDGMAPGLLVPQATDGFPPMPPIPALPAMPGAAPEPPVPPASPASLGKHGKHGKHAKSSGDRVVAGSTFKLEKGESLDDLTVFGGAADIYGTVNGDVAVIGGSTRVHEGAVVHGDAVAVGGSLTVDDGARVDGDLGAVGGSVHRGEKAIIGGKVKATAGFPGVSGTTTKNAEDTDDGDDDDHADEAEAASDQAEAAAAASTAGNIAAASSHVRHGDGDDDDESHMSGPVRLFRSLMKATTVAAMLFLFGCVFLALGTKRMEALKLEAAVRPMRSLALGVVGSLAAVIIACALCITIVGIPVAGVGFLIALFAAYAGVCAVLTMVGEVLLRHRTQNGYVHLAAGCALLAFLGALPWIGGLVTAGVVLMGIGTLVATRGAGLVPMPKSVTPAGPYRTESNPESL